MRAENGRFNILTAGNFLCAHRTTIRRNLAFPTRFQGGDLGSSERGKEGRKMEAEKWDGLITAIGFFCPPNPQLFNLINC